MNAATEKTLATIELDNGEGRGELFVRGGEVWCRRVSDGEETATGVPAGATEEQAVEAIHQSWRDGLGTWDLQWSEDAEGADPPTDLYRTLTDETPAGYYATYETDSGHQTPTVAFVGPFRTAAAAAAHIAESPADAGTITPHRVEA